MPDAAAPPSGEPKQQVVVLTGAGGRFGRILAERLIAEPGLFPVLLTSDPGKLPFPPDDQHARYRITLADPQSVREVFARIHDEQGDIDALINNAAVITVPGFEDFVRNVDDGRVLESFAVNAGAALLCIKYALERGRPRGKKIINILAGRALTGHLRHVEYYASKAGLYNATKTLANDYPEHVFRNVMSGRIDLGDHGDSPDSMWAYIRDLIHEARPAPYREVYFRPRGEYLWRLLQYYWRHFRSCERRPVKRN
ncbi:MAG: SDR family oxidoreductase [Kiloniellales bacterium]|nr:SDR family oxidoreductase [Kiloniellales bacterium]